MGTSTEIDAVWESTIWTHATVQGFTANYFQYDISEDNAFDVTRFYHAAAGEAPTINFFLCLVQRRSDPNQVAGGGTATRYTFTVRVEYYLQQTDVADDTYRVLRDRLEAVDDLVRSGLGATWSGTVQYWEGGVPLPITKVTIDERACWKGGYTYTAVKAN